MKTKLALVLCATVLIHAAAKSQVKIGDNATTVNSASLLELETTNKGFVLPRVSITNINSSTPLAAGLLTGTIVYNTNSSTTGGSGTGIYYWDGSKWNFLANTTFTGNYWSVTGNSGTSPSSNFIGTTDAKDFVARTNNVERMRILGATSGSSQVGWIGMGVALPKSALDVAGNYSGKNVITIQNTSSTGFSSVDMLDNSGNLATTFGFANSGTGTAFSGKAYLNGYGNDFLFTRGSSYDLIMKGNNGYVGINTSTPSERLHVVGNFYLTGAFMPGGNAGTAGYVLTSAGTNTAPTWSNLNSLSWNLLGNSGTNASTNFIGTTDAVDFVARTNNVERFRITSTGNVGIGLTNPAYKLAVLSASNPLYLSGVQATSTFSTDSVLTINAGIVKKAPYSSLTGNFWSLKGNSGTSYATDFIGTTDNVSLRFRTNNTEQMILDSLGTLSVGSYGAATFNPDNPPKLSVDYGTTTSNTIAYLRGSIDSYLQINLRNKSNGTSASTDYVATADDGTDSTYYVDLGINSSNYATGVENWGGPHDAYLYASSRNLLIGTQASSSDVIFLLGGGRSRYNTVLRLDGSTGNVIVGTGNNQPNATGNIIRGPNGGNGTNIPGGSLTLQGGASNGNTSGGNLNLYGGGTVSGTYGSVNINTSTNSATNINTGTSTANVTIGNSSNNILFPKFNTSGSMFYTSAATGQIASTGSNMIWNNSNNSLGIGISNPAYKLSVLAPANPLYLSGVQATTTFTIDSVLTIYNGVVKKVAYSSLPGSVSGWSLTGNSGTNTTTNFLGTTDNTGLVFKVNNTEAGYLANSFNQATAFGYSSSGTSTGQYGTAIGATAQATAQYASAFGYSSSAIGQYSIALGYNASAGFQYASAIGTGSSAGNQYATALGYSASATSQSSLALGYNSTAGNQDAVAAGNGSNASTAQSIAIGGQAAASGYQGIAIGYNSGATISSNTLAIGVSAAASGYQASAIGYSTVASNSQALAVGNNATASGSQSTAIGNNTSATGTNSTAIGNGASTSQNNALILGNTSANVGIATSTPSTSASLDVNGKFKMGDIGTVNKNVVSFASTLGSTNLAAGTGGPIVLLGTVTFAGSSTDVTVTIPSSANYLTSTRATVSVSPNFDLPTGVSIASARMISTSQLKIRFVNATTNSQNISGQLYITINEF